MKITKEFIGGLNIGPEEANELNDLLNYFTLQQTVLKNTELNAKVQKEAYEARFKQDARKKALDTAQYLQPDDTNPKNTGWDVLVESERIYQWLIDIK